MKRTSKMTNAIFTIILCLTVVVFTGQALAQGGTWTTKTSMNTARNSPHVAAIGGLLYVAGGQGVSGSGTTVLEAYDPSGNSWTTLAPMPSSAYAGATGVIGGKLYVAGGWGTYVPRNTLQIYDPGTNSWSYGPSITATASPPSGLSAAGAGGVIAGKLYLLTACNGYSYPPYRKSFAVFDPTGGGSWSALPQPANIHVGPASGVIGGKLYVVGGFDIGSNITATLDVYDAGTNTWATMTPMPTARLSPFGGVLDGKLYVAGGWDGSADLDTVEVYDPGTDSWATMTPMPTARNGAHGGISSPAIDGKLYMVGGQAGASVLATLEVFTPGEVSTIEDLIVFIRDDTLSDAVIPDVGFKNPKMRRPLQNKLSALIEFVHEADSAPDELTRAAILLEAIDKLQYDIMAKTDGSDGGNPKNDWIGAPYAHELYLLLKDVLDALSAELYALSAEL